MRSKGTRSTGSERKKRQILLLLYLATMLLCLVSSHRKHVPAYALERPRLAKSRRIDCWDIMVTVTVGMDEMFVNWLHWYDSLGCCHRLFVCTPDDEVEAKYRTVNRSDIVFVKEEVLFRSVKQTSVAYGTPEYKALMSHRPRSIMTLMRRFNISKLLFADIDSVWLGDPVEFFLPGYDLIASVDGFSGQAPFICGGFVAYISTPKTWELLQAWNKELQVTPQHNQPMLNSLVRRLRVRVLALPSLHFPSGKMFFERNTRKYAVVVHANFMVGRERKVKALKEAGLWAVSTHNHTSSAGTLL